jgi:hypothetical protein
MFHRKHGNVYPSNTNSWSAPADGLVLLEEQRSETAKLLPVLASKMILGSESHGTHVHIAFPDESETLQTPNPADTERSEFPAVPRRNSKCDSSRKRNPEIRNKLNFVREE